MKHVIRFLGVQFVAYVVVAMVLCIGWATAAPAVSSPPVGCHAYAADCYRRPLLNGRPGETVEVCERVRLVCSKVVRQGYTTVEHH